MLAGLSAPHGFCGGFRAPKPQQNEEKVEDLFTKTHKCQDSLFYIGNSFVFSNEKVYVFIIKKKNKITKKKDESVFSLPLGFSDHLEEIINPDLIKAVAQIFF